MKFDRNTVLGFVTLALLFFGYFYYNSKEQNRYLAEKKKQDAIQWVKDSTKRAQDSIASFRTKPQPAGTAIVQAAPADSTGFSAALNGTESTTEASTNLLRVVFTNKGGQPKTVELLKFKGPGNGNVKMASS